MMSMEHIKAGDEVWLSPTWRGPGSVVSVDRVTKTQIVCGDARFRRRDGWKVGAKGWRTQHIEDITRERLEAIERHQAIEAIRSAVNNGLDGVSLDDLRLVKKTLEAAQGGE
mgnify:CR=1 FL=1